MKNGGILRGLNSTFTIKQWRPSKLRIA
jgi:hypothetical protein